MHAYTKITKAPGLSFDQVRAAEATADAFLQEIPLGIITHALEDDELLQELGADVTHVNTFDWIHSEAYRRMFPVIRDNVVAFEIRVDKD